MTSRGKADAFSFLKRKKYISFVYDSNLSRSEKLLVIDTLLKEGKMSKPEGLAVKRLLDSNLSKYDAILLGVK